MNFTTFLVQIADALQGSKGQELAYLLSPREAHAKSIVKDFRNPSVRVLGLEGLKGLIIDIRVASKSVAL